MKIISQFTYQLKISWRERLQNAKFVFIMLLIFMRVSKKPSNISNTFFNLWEILSFSRELRKAIFFNGKMVRQILDPKHKGVKAWEYGTFLTKVNLKKGIKVLDVGSGESALPFYLANLGLDVTAFDLDTPFESANKTLIKKYPKVRYNRGSMLNLPYKEKQFDLVLCISAIEHLDYLPERKKTIEYKEFTKRTKKAIAEMIRVLKPEGRLFLTSDIFFSELQKKDRWPQAFLHKKIGSAFKKEDFQKVFIETLTHLGCLLIGEIDFNFDDIIKDIKRCNYRGRYFTTFSIYAQKR